MFGITKLTASLCVLVGAAVIAAGAGPLREGESANGRYTLRIRAGQPGQDAVRGCKAGLFEKADERTRVQPVWERFLVNDVAPEHVVIRDDGAFVVTLDEYRVGGARNALVVYGKRGELLRHFLLTDLLGKEDWKFIKARRHALEWLSDAKFEFDSEANLFAIRFGGTREILIDLERLCVVREDGAAYDGSIPPEIAALLYGTGEIGEDGESVDAEAPEVVEGEAGEAAAEDATEVAANAEGEAGEASAGEQAVAEETTEVAAEAAEETAPVEAYVRDVPPELEGTMYDVPMPDPANPVDYLAWVNSHALTDGPSAVPEFDLAISSFVDWQGDPDLLKAASGGDPDALANPEIQAWIDSNLAAVSSFRNATQFEFEGWQLHSDDGSMVGALLPALAPLRNIARVAVMDGRRMEANGFATGAAETYVDTLSAGGQIGHGPTLIENLVGVAVQSMAANAILDMAASPEADTVDFAHVADGLRNANQLHPLSETIQGERAMLLDVLQRVYTYDDRTGTYWLNQQEASMVSSMAGSSSSDILNWLSVSVISDSQYQKLVGDSNRYYDELAATLELPFENGVHPTAALEESFINQKGLHPILHTMVPALSRLAFVKARGESTRRATTLVAELQAYRQANGVYPESLDALRDAQSSVDPFTGGRFQYRLDGDDFVLYSVGKDGIDDGGVHDPKAETNDFRFWPRPVNEE